MHIYGHIMKTKSNKSGTRGRKEYSLTMTALSGLTHYFPQSRIAIYYKKSQRSGQVKLSLDMTCFARFLNYVDRRSNPTWPCNSKTIQAAKDQTWYTSVRSDQFQNQPRIGFTDLKTPHRSSFTCGKLGNPLFTVAVHPRQLRLTNQLLWRHSKITNTTANYDGEMRWRHRCQLLYYKWCTYIFRL